MLKMFFPGKVIDENVIKENEDKFSEIWFEQVIHEALKSGWGITETKWHDQEFIMAFMSSESSLWNVYFFHANLVIAQAKVELSKELSPIQFIQQIIDNQDGKFIFDSQLIKGPKVWTHTSFPIFLEHHDPWR